MSRFAATNEQRQPPAKRQLIVLGSTGSIGVNTLEVIDHLKCSGAANMDVVALAAGRNVSRLLAQARAYNPKAVAIADPEGATELRRGLPDTIVFAGANAALEMVEQVEATDTVAAVVGAAGLPATLAAIRKSQRISLANKETLVAAGAMVSPLTKEHSAILLPVDSEHSALHQCLQDHPRESVKRIVLTASGGPFRTTSKQQIENATVEQALNHPTWDMGPKITVDSATMMNKALEIIEAHWLFDLPAEKIEVIIHPQSIVHSFVEFEDHSILAQIGPPDMRTPIQYALTWPKRLAGCSKAMDWSTLSTLVFEQPDFDRFGSLKLAYRAIKAGGTAGAVLNGANEAAVAAFLNRTIRFGRIVELVAEAMDAIRPVPIESLASVHEADRQARQFVSERISLSV